MSIIIQIAYFIKYSINSSMFKFKNVKIFKFKNLKTVFKSTFKPTFKNKPAFNKLPRYYSNQSEIYKELQWHRQDENFFETFSTKYKDDPLFWKEAMDIMKIPILKYVPSNIINAELCALAVSKHPETEVDHIPNHIKTREFYLGLINQYGRIPFESIDKLIITKDMPRDEEFYINLVKGYSLKYVPVDKITKKICLTAIDRYAFSLEYVPTKYKDYDLCMRAYNVAPSTIEYIPKSILDIDMCMKAVKYNGSLLKFVPDEFKNMDICIHAVENRVDALEYVPNEIKLINDFWKRLVHSRNSSILKFMPEKLKTYEFCSAIRYYKDDLIYVPDNLKTKDFYLQIIQNSNSFSSNIDELYGLFADISSKNMLDNDIYEKLVEKSHKILPRIPAESRTRKLCMIAIKQDSMSLQHVPMLLRDHEMCLTAIKNAPGAINYFPISHIPTNVLNEEICTRSVMKNGRLLQLIPNHLKTINVCMMAINQDPAAIEHVPSDLLLNGNGNGIGIGINISDWSKFNIKYIPDKYKTREISEDAVKKNGKNLEWVPAKYINATMCFDAVENNGNALKYVPINMITNELVLLAIKRGADLSSIPSCFETYKTVEFYNTCINYNPGYLAQIEKKYITREMCINAIKKETSILPLIPKELLDKEICMIAMMNSKDGRELQWVPNELIDYELCVEANKRGTQAFEFTPKKFVNNYLMEITSQAYLNEYIEMRKYTVY